MHFLLQTDDVSIIEKRAIRAAAMLIDAKLSFASINSLQSGEINPDIPPDTVPVGTVEFVSAVMGVRGLNQPEHMSYPECLAHHLHRKVREGELSEAIGDVFVKPRHDVKRFTGALLPALLSEPDVFNLAADYPVWISDPVRFTSEWRYYIVGGQVVGAGRYDDGADELPEPDINQVREAAQAMLNARGPAGYALDFGVLEDGRTALVEANDGWALGYYKGSCSYVDYANLLHARWFQIMRL